MDGSVHQLEGGVDASQTDDTLVGNDLHEGMEVVIGSDFSVPPTFGGGSRQRGTP